MKKKHQDRAYQQEIEDSVFEYLFEETGNPVVASPGGTGKSYVMAKLTKKFVTDWPGTRVILLAQDAKLLDQNSNELLRLWPEAPIGIYSAGLKQRDTQSPIIFAGIQSVAKRAEEFGERNIVIVDECDQISHKEETLYQKFIFDLKQVNPKLRVIGFTATAYRLGMGCLTNLDLWDKIVIDLTKTERFNWFVENEFLAPLVTKRTTHEIDVTNIAMKGGEFDEKSMQEVADTDELNLSVVEECIRYGAERKHWLVFASGVKHGHKLAKLFNSKGVPTVMLSGEDSMAHREEQEGLFRSGKVRCLVNCGLYGRGWNFPALDLVAWVRATQSTALWVQGTVRGTRTAPGKQNCIARGQRVLTDKGLVPIEQVTRKMKVWDGLDFVSHEGAVCMGNQHTITYAGLTATPDHKVKTEQGWKTLWQSFLEQAPIRLTGADEQPLREASNCFRYGGKAERTNGQSIRKNSVRAMRDGVLTRLHKCLGWTSGLSKVWEKTVSAADASAVALQPMFRCESTMQQPRRFSIFAIWRTRDQVFIQESDGYGRVDSKKSGAAPTSSVRSEGQQRALRSGKSEILNSQSAAISHTTEVEQLQGKPLSAKVSRNPLRRFYATRLILSWFHRHTDNRAVLPTILQTEREVWDILNCGPRHCFTCEGLLVHNCMILDFAGNIRRNGPINDPIIPSPRRKGEAVKGEAPVKECPECHSYLHTRTMICPDCGYVFPPPSTIKKTASEAEILRKTSDSPIVEEFAVYGIRYKPSVSRSGNPYLGVSYMVGTTTFKECVFFGHENNFLQRKVKMWWTYRGGNDPVPQDATEAAERAGNELKVPSLIRVDVAKKYPEVVGADFEAEPEMFDSAKCTCHEGRPPCAYCESGDYIPF